MERSVWEEIIPNWDNQKATRRVRDLFKQGLPPDLRARIWFLAQGNRQAISKDLFEIMAERGYTLKALLKSQSALEQQLVDLKIPEPASDPEKGSVQYKL
jgi:hypothetical protein